jgi:hypothetical protein
MHCNNNNIIVSIEFDSQNDTPNNLRLLFHIAIITTKYYFRFIVQE